MTQIRIPSPCSQNPKNFTPSNLGGFCQACQKEVVDFRKMNQQEVLEFITENPSKSCGIFKKSQVFDLSEPQKTKKLGLFWIVTALGILGFSLPSSGVNQGFLDPTKTEISLENYFPKKGSSISKVLKGRVFSGEDKQALPTTTILIKGTTIGVHTNLKGEFELVIPDSIAKNRITLLISFVGYQTELKKVNLKKDNPNLGDIFLKEHDSVLGPYGLITPKKSFWGQLISYFKNQGNQNSA
ncbi:carboxypeptidase-like protein [Algoriphagus boseongensis]|uniref:Carboxypeptidase-like protein n=1 Tax=Algoriphagus boseongensis TaxID=1442587 RepID=A0A4R6T7C9_9BACT|nr:carboxypeptidase-like regulatory domain-containing protein [Algoriphagus boseongensis]TDQ17532.1 carboxypeptidase-like protein [Algoriphagus boseongensis]